MDIKGLEQYRYNMNVQKTPQFTIIDSTGVLREYPLHPENQSRLVIGRSAECDIKVECSGMSNIHGKFKWINGKLYYADMGSTNGTYIHKQGKTYFEKKSRNYLPLADGDFLSIHPQVQDAKNGFILLYTEQNDGARWTKVDIGNEKITLGRSGNNDIVIRHVGASRKHAEIVRYQDGYVIRDLSSIDRKSVV